MKLVTTYDLKDYNPEWPHSTRPSARAIILFDNEKIAMVHSKKYGYYKFPGGGIHNDENPVEALIREVKEETGLQVIKSSVKEYGYIKRLQKSDFLENTIFEQDSLYYTCNVENQITEQNLDDYEAEEGFELEILPVQKAIQINHECKSSNGFDIVMIARDTLILEKLINFESIPSISAAEYLLSTGYKKNPGPWEKHSYSVATCAAKIAKAINAAGGNMNVEKAYVCGLLHDIGRQEGFTYLRHVYDGYNYMKSFGYDSIAKVCLTHSFNLHITDDYIGKNDLQDNQYEELKKLLSETKYDDYDRLIQLLDSTCGADGTLDLENRMNDVKVRYGYYPEDKWNKNFELKKYFEEKMKKEYYSVIRN